MAFERGFKTRCENLAETVRKDLGLRPDAPLAPEGLADYLGIQLLHPEALPGMSASSLQALLVTDADDWSALTLGGEDRRSLIIFNPTHSTARRASDLSHEMSHLLLRHAPSTLMFSPDATWTLRSFDAGQEDEANWLAGCLLLPRVALLDAIRQGVTDDIAAARFGVSLQMLRYRRGVTGVERQAARS